jgi:hypothetical protein
VVRVRNSVHQLVGLEQRFFLIQQAIYLRREGVPVSKEASPNRGVDQYLLGVWFSRRLLAGASGHLSRPFRTHEVFGAFHRLRVELTPPVPVELSPYR